jgi:hypothetical protein
MCFLPAAVASCVRAVTAISRVIIPSATIATDASHTETKRQTMDFQKSGDF